MTSGPFPDASKTHRWTLAELDVFQRSLRNLLHPELNEFHAYSREIVDQIVEAYLTTNLLEKSEAYRRALGRTERAQRVLLGSEQIFPLSPRQRDRLQSDLGTLSSALAELVGLLAGRK
jgi:hypothetical protein